jgi:membrane associated rhomboid family serine protease
LPINYSAQVFKSQFFIPSIYLILLILVFWAEQIFPNIETILSILPRNFAYLGGIISTVFIHKNLEHLSGNSLTLLICLYGIFYFYKEIALKVTLYSHILTGFLVWLFATRGYHIGASGLVYALVFFVLVSGFIRNNKRLLIFAFAVLVMQSGLIWGIFPFKEGVSWESHLFGAMTGILLAIIYRKEGPQSDKIDNWAEELPEDEVDEYLNL